MRKLLSKKGFTLAEMLIAVMLLGFVSAMATVMTSAVLNTSTAMKETAQAQILGSEALENLQDRLRLALNVEVDETAGSVTFDIDRANTGYTFYIEDDRIFFGQPNTDGSFKGELLFSGVSYGNLKVTELSFSLGESGNSLRVDLVIAFGSDPVWSGGIGIVPLNGVKPKTP